MNYVTVAQAARRTGLSERAIYDRINDHSLTAHGVKLRIPEDSLTQFILDRQQTTAAKVGDLKEFADRVRRRAQQLGGAKGTVLQLDKDALKIFGPHTVKASAMADNRGCRWCWARLTASVYGGLEPQLDEPHQILLGQPCREDLTAMREKLRARWSGSRPTSANPEPARTAAAKPKPPITRHMGNKACGTPVGTPCSCHSSDRPGGPRRSQRDDGNSLTASRRKALTAALQEARTRGDLAHARQVQKLLAALKPQAVRTSKPASNPPRTTPRSGPHGCGCQCEQHRSQP